MRIINFFYNRLVYTRLLQLHEMRRNTARVLLLKSNNFLFSFKDFFKKLLRLIKFILNLPKLLYKEFRFLLSELKRDAIEGISNGFEYVRRLAIYDSLCFFFEQLENMYEHFLELRKKPRRFLAKIIGDVVIHFFYQNKSKIGVENRIMWFFFDGLSNFIFFYASIFVLVLIYKIKTNAYINIFNFWYHDYYILYLNVEIFLLNLYHFGVYRKFYLLQPLLIIVFFLLFLYIRSALPRYKLVEFQNLYWKQLIIYSFLILIIFSIV